MPSSSIPGPVLPGRPLRAVRECCGIRIPRDICRSRAEALTEFQPATRPDRQRRRCGIGDLNGYHAARKAEVAGRVASSSAQRVLTVGRSGRVPLNRVGAVGRYRMLSAIEQESRSATATLSLALAGRLSRRRRPSSRVRARSWTRSAERCREPACGR